jgi:LmbE family N-acetylglucosaminyl deacetylase
MCANLKKTILNTIKPIIMPWNRMTLKSFYKENKQLTEMNALGAKVLFLAPHVDDETIGAGGTILRHVEQGDDVTVVYMTDGAKSVTKMDRDVLVKARKAEAQKVKEILGFRDMLFLDLPDGEVKSTPNVQNRLLKLLESINPEYIYCPTFVDCHPDHIATAEIVADTLVNYNRDCMVRLYEINCPIPPKEINVIVDISQQIVKKNLAIGVFTSQAIDFDGFQELSYIKQALLSASNSKAVETFLEIPSQQYVVEAKSVIDKRRNYNEHFKQVNKAVTLGVRVKKNAVQKQKFYQERKMG